MKYIVTRPKPRQEKLKLEDILLDLIDDAKLARIGQISSPTATRVFKANDGYTKDGDWYANRRFINYTIEQMNKFYEKNSKYDIFFNDEYNYEEQLKITKKVEREMYKTSEYVDDDVVAVEVQNRMKSAGMKYIPYYYTFYLPKRSGKGFRQIDAPTDEFKLVLKEFKLILEQAMSYNTYHTSAYAYIPKRSRVDLVQKLKNNKSRWILSLDFSNFFGSINLPWTMKQISKIYPFSDIVKVGGGKEILEKCLRLCFLDGRLPQGTPISPLLTNILMIPIDYEIANKLLNDAKEITQFDEDNYGDNYRLIYTRYADDIFIGAHRGFRWKPVMEYIQSVLAEFDAPMKIKPEKTKYKSTNGQNFILGLMYNQDYNITVGHKKKKQVKAMISNFAMDYKNHVSISAHDVQVIRGNISHLHQIEPEYTDEMLIKAREKFGIDILKTMSMVMNAA